jgi:hypothetical protein
MIGLSIRPWMRPPVPLPAHRPFRTGVRITPPVLQEEGSCRRDRARCSRMNPAACCPPRSLLACPALECCTLSGSGSADQSVPSRNESTPMVKRPSSSASAAVTGARSRVASGPIPGEKALVAPTTRAKAPVVDPKPGAQADPRRPRSARSRPQRGGTPATPADHPQLDRDNRHRERINIPDSHKGATPMSDHKRNDRTPKRH